LSYVLSFTNKEYEPYTGLESYEDVIEAIREEVEKIVADGGSDMYEPIWDDGSSPEPTNTDLDPEEWSDRSDAAHERGIKAASERWVETAKDALWNTALENGGVTQFRFPDGTTLLLQEETDETAR